MKKIAMSVAVVLLLAWVGWGVWGYLATDTVATTPTSLQSGNKDTTPTTTTVPPTTGAHTTVSPTTVPPTTVPPTTVPPETQPPIPPETQPPIPPETQPPIPPETQPPIPPETQPPIPPETQPPIPPEISARAAFAYDYTNQRMVFLKGDPNARVEPASITKLFTAYVACQYLQPETVLTVGEEVGWIDPDSSRAMIWPGYQLTVQMCLQGMLLPSGNDAAYVLAVAAGRSIAGDPQLAARAALDVFLTEMNNQAQGLGMTGTHFENPDGIHGANHYTCLQDLVTIATLTMQFPEILEILRMDKLTVTLVSGQRLRWENSNLLLHSASRYFCPDAIGLKTGSTNAAGKCLLSAFRQEERCLLVCVLGCPNDGARYEDTLALYQQYFT